MELLEGSRAATGLLTTTLAQVEIESGDPRFLSISGSKVRALVRPPSKSLNRPCFSNPVELDTSQISRWGRTWGRGRSFRCLELSGIRAARDMPFGGSGFSVCRMHGANGGAPKGNRNALKHGGFTAESLALKRDNSGPRQDGTREDGRDRIARCGTAHVRSASFPRSHRL
jgi:hypothetical protein